MFKRKIKVNSDKIKVTDLIIPEDYSLAKTGLTQSLMNIYFQCRRKFVITLNRWEPLAKMNVFDFGNFIHETLDNAIKEKRALTSSEIVKIIEDYCNKKFLMGEKVSENKVKALSTMLNYFEYYSDDYEYYNFLYSEKEVAKLYKGVLLKGKIDGCFSCKKVREGSSMELGRTYLMEHKTKGSMDDFSKTLTYDFQTQFYPFISENNVNGILYNIIKKPQQRVGKKENLNTFKTRLEEKIRNEQEVFFERYEIILDLHSKGLFIRELNAKLKEIIYFVENKKIAFPVQSACQTGYMKCPFIDMCSTGEIDTMQYKQRDKVSPELDTI